MTVRDAVARDGSTYGAARRFGAWRFGVRRFGVRRFAGLVLGLALGTNVALAQKKPRVVTITEVTIVGRIQKPIAAVDVSRIRPKLTLAELRRPFLDRIERAIYHAPF